MRLRGVLERVRLVNIHLDLVSNEHLKELSRVLLKFLALSDIVVDDGAHELEVLGAEAENVDRGNSSRLSMVSWP